MPSEDIRKRIDKLSWIDKIKASLANGYDSEAALAKMATANPSTETPEERAKRLKAGTSG